MSPLSHDQQQQARQLEVLTGIYERLAEIGLQLHELNGYFYDMAKSTKGPIDPNTAMQSNGNKVQQPTNADKKPQGKAPKGK